MTTLRTVPRDRVRVGVVGCGVVADYGHIPTIHRSPLAELVAFADPNPERRATQAKRYDLPAFASFEEMAAAVEMDAVTIATQPAQKLEMARLAAEHGLHAFCEKPLTDTVAQAEELVRLMDDAGLAVGVAFINRGKELVQRMMELVREGAIGPLRAVHIEDMWDYHGLRDIPERGDRRHRALRNLGTLDCGVHDLDLVRYMTGADYADISAIGTIVEPANIYPDHIMMQARMSNGVLVSVQESAVWGYTAVERPIYEQSYRLLGDRGFMVAQQGDWKASHPKTELRIVSGERQWTEHLESGKAWEATYEQFYLTVLGREIEHPFLATGHDALANMRAAEEIVTKCGYKVGVEE